MGNFIGDLKKGKEAEIKLIYKLRELGYNVFQNPIEKEMDILFFNEGEIINGVECKLDIYSKYSGNFYIEFECNGKPSGIFREENYNLVYWAQCNSEKCFMITGNKLKEFVIFMIKECRNNKSLISNGIRLVEKGGNGGRTKGLLIPIDKFEDMSEFIINMSENSIN